MTILTTMLASSFFCHDAVGAISINSGESSRLSQFLSAKHHVFVVIFLHSDVEYSIQRGQQVESQYLASYGQICVIIKTHKKLMGLVLFIFLNDIIHHPTLARFTCTNWERFMIFEFHPQYDDLGMELTNS